MDRAVVGGMRWASLVVGVVLVVSYIAGIGVTTYVSQGRLREAALDELRLTAEKRAAALSHFYAERRNDLTEITADRAVTSFYANRALGMSMEYGLGASLQLVADHFDAVIRRTTLDGVPVFTRLMLVDQDGRVLVDRRGEGGAPAPVDGRRYLAPEPRGARLLAVDPGRQVLVSAPCHFKDAYAGQVLAWIAQRRLYGHFIDDDPILAGRHEYLLDGDGRPLPTLSLHPGPSERLLPELATLTPGRSAVYSLQDASGAVVRLVGLRLAIGDTPFSLVTLLPYEQVFSASVPWQLLVASAAMPLLLAAGRLRYLRFRRAHRDLRERVLASDRRGHELQHRNLALEEEVRRREQAEAALRTEQAAVMERTRQLQQAMQEAHHLAFYDSLTRLPNRRLFHETVERTLDAARRRAEMVALLFLDLDNFKRINDTLGHQVGDELLRGIARRLTEGARRGDQLARVIDEDTESTVSRLGGDEFTILLCGLRSPTDAATVAQRLLRSVSRPLVLEGMDVLVTASVGISVFPKDAADADGVLRNADTAMYRAKEAGGNGYRFYEPHMNAHALHRLGMEHRIRQGLEQGAFELFYQPKVDLLTGAVCGAEALLRWPQPAGGYVSPAEFIPVAEESGLILPLGEWVLRRACEQLVTWQGQGLPVVPVAVNVSGRQMQRQNLYVTVAAAIEASGVDPALLEVEMTESVLLENTADAKAVLQGLKALGLSVAIDDFGTGYSSLSYLKVFPIDTLKVDRSFVREVPHDPNDAAIVRAIVAMARTLGLRVVAEGVETGPQFEFLRELGCHQMQGYLFSPPVPPDRFAAFLGRRQPEVPVAALVSA